MIDYRLVTEWTSALDLVTFNCGYQHDLSEYQQKKIEKNYFQLIVADEVMGFPGGASGNKPSCQGRKHESQV